MFHTSGGPRRRPCLGQGRGRWTRDHCLGGIHGKPKVSLSGRVRDGASKQLIAKQLQGLTEDMPRFDVETGQIKCKKPKKSKTPQEQAVVDLKQFEKKILYSKI